MVNPITSKAALKPLDAASEQAAGSPVKTSESKFDKIRAQLQDEHARQVQIPPEVREVSMEQKKVLQADLAKRIEHTGSTSAHKIFKGDLQRAKEGMHELTKRVDALPKTPAFEPFRNRLAGIDAQFHDANRLVHSIKSGESPGDLMKIQMQMYQLTENLELMSKVVEQVTSGVKSILQTQV